ncbi:MAG: type II toxin-antitoxin system VapC family toxin [Prosthecobacter sp.]|uniref:type II toxin-antitoxin system VapC family toxin n=1 Tax=Prosthecobacter sp. TaxID=1965333 RepID=UPI00390388D3
MPPIADTGWLVAFWNARDAHHDWARGVEITAPPLVCEAVLTEAAWLLGTPAPLLSMLAVGDIKTTFSAESEAAALIKWLAKYEDIDPGLADACVVRMAELNPKRPVLTVDRRDFDIYRTLSGKPVNCIFPPS